MQTFNLLCHLAPASADGYAPGGANVVYLSTRILNNRPATEGEFAGTGLSSTGKSTLERTSSHELGHSGWLTHPKGLVAYLYNNLMNPSYDKDAGTGMHIFQIKSMWDQYNKGNLNNGTQAQ